MDILVLQTTGGIGDFQIFKNSQILSGNAVRIIGSTEIAFFSEH